MPASSSNSVTRFLEETTPGTIESGGPQVWRVTGGALSQSTESSEDNELRSDRGRGDTTMVSGSVGGSYDINWSHKTHHDFLEGLMCAASVAVGTDGVLTVSDMAFDETTHTISSAGAELPAMEVGQWFKISGAGDALNDGFYKCHDTTAPTTSAVVVDTNVKDVGADDTAESTVISSTRLKQGNVTTLRTWTLERELVDVSRFFTWKYCHVSSLNLNWSITDKLSGAFGFLGAALEVTASTTAFPGIASEVDAETTPFFNSVTGTTVLLDGEDMGESCAESLSLDIQGNLRERKCLGSGLAASSIGSDPFKISGTANVYFGSSASLSLYQNKIADTPLTFSVCVTDSDGNGVAFTMPRCKISSAEVDGGSMGSDVMLSLNFDAVSDPTLETMLIVDVLGSTA